MHILAMLTCQDGAEEDQKKGLRVNIYLGLGIALSNSFLVQTILCSRQWAWDLGPPHPWEAVS